MIRARMIGIFSALGEACAKVPSFHGRQRCPLTVALITWAGAMLLPLHAQESDGWQVRTFRLPHSWWEPWTIQPPAPPPGGDPFAPLPPADPFAPAPPQPAPAPPVIFQPLPAPDASEQVWDEHIRKSRQSIRQVLRNAGVEAPEESFFLLDVDSGTLVARSSPAVLAQLEILANELKTRLPLSVAFTLDILQADAAVIRQTVAESARRSDHAALWERLRGLVNEGKAVHVTQLRLETRSGQRATTEAGMEITLAQGLKFDHAERAEPTRETSVSGTHLEVDPVIGPDALTVDADVTLEHHFAPPVQRHAFAGWAGPRRRVETPVTDFRFAKIKTSTTWLDGMKQLIGVWTPEGRPKFAHGDVMQAAFLGMNLVTLLPAENKTLQARLERFYAKAQAPPPAAKPTVPAPTPAPEISAVQMPLRAGLEERKFKVPADFWSTIASMDQEKPKEPIDPFAPAPADPFAPVDPFAPSGSGQAPPKDGWRTIHEVIKKSGVTFPEGSNLRFDTHTGSLVMTNTPKNLDLTAAFIEKLWVDSKPSLLIHTLHIVEGDGATFRQMAADAQKMATHDALWEEVEKLAAQGRVKLRETVRLETKRGIVVVSEAGTQHTGVSGQASGGDANATTTVEHFVRMTGTRVEVDSALAADSRSLDVRLSLEHHFAPPTTRPKPDPEIANDGRRIDLPVTDFHCGNIATTLKTMVGAMKLAGTWKVEGPPELDGKDVMQAAFLRVDLVTLGRD